MSSFNLHAAKHHDQFGRIDLKVSLGGSRELFKRAAFEPFGPDRQPVVVPSENLDVVPLAIEEHKQVTGEQIDVEMLFNQSRQTAKQRTNGMQGVATGKLVKLSW